VRTHRFIAFFLLCIALLTPCSIAAAKADGPSRPNIVLFIADDLSWHDLGCYGSPDVHTPNVDKLAKQSLRFTQAVASSPTCTPSRCGIYTGMYPFRNGAHANHSWINEGVQTLPNYMKQLGYRVVIAGKTHIGPREQFPFEYLKGSNVMPPGKKHVLFTDLNTAAVDQLLAEHDKATPLCLLVCSHSPHVFWMDNDGSYDPKKITVPPYLLDTPQTREMRCKYYTDVSHMDAQLGDVLASLAKHGFDDAGTLVLFTADQGAQWPFAKWNLYDAGIRVPLMARWVGKIKPGTTTDALVSLVDLLPTMLNVAEAADQVTPKLDGHSLLPVLLGRSAHQHDAVFASNTGDGNMNRSPMRAVRTSHYKYILNLLPDALFKTHISDGGGEDGLFYWRSWEALAKTDAHAKQVIEHYRHRPAEEMYDIQADPYELKNLAADPAHAKDLDAMREMLRKWRLDQGEDLSKVPMPEDSRKGPLPYAG
jgi:arylsulfatase A-like enzyme